MNKNDNRTQLLHTLKVTFKTDSIIKKQKKKQKKNKKKTVTEPFKIKLPAARASKGKKKSSVCLLTLIISAENTFSTLL